MIIKLTASTPTEILKWNPRRTRLMIQMQPSSVDANNTGIVFIGAGFQPVATVGHASQGEAILQSGGIQQPAGGALLDEKYKKSIWANSDTNNQTIVVEEEVSNL